MKYIAVFDFDHTITKRDTFLQFIKFTRGVWKCYLGFLFLSPVIFLWKTGVIKNWQAKQIVFSFFFRGVTVTQFKEWGLKFTEQISTNVKLQTLSAINEHFAKGHKVIIISASIENWIIPWAKSIGIDTVIATTLEISDAGELTGRFSSSNCYGPEKVNRLLKEFPDFSATRSGYHITAYGDSAGDNELFAFADTSYFVHSNGRISVLSKEK